jgi:DNA-3-methyladenine glycosylase II
VHHRLGGAGAERPRRRRALEPGPLSKATEHLRKSDPVLRRLIDEVGETRRIRPAVGNDHYGALVRAIVGQQLSTKAAAAIYGRLTERFGGRNPTPAEVLADDPEELRTAAGLSHAKVKYLRSLAQHIEDGELDLDRMNKLSDEDVSAELIKVKGLGKWSIDMFLMFHLERPDVLPVGDLGIRQAFQRVYGLDELPGPTDMERIAEPWRPYRTLASRYLWASLDNEPV